MVGLTGTSLNLMEVLMGSSAITINFAINGGLFIASFDYWRQ